LRATRFPILAAPALKGPSPIGDRKPPSLHGKRWLAGSIETIDVGGGEAPSDLDGAGARPSPRPEGDDR
ncbi:MAG TPA: hypothetical protein VF234_03430, partial [Limnochordia bacterium]